MTLDPTATIIYCQTCATAWQQVDEGTGYYFRSASVTIGDYGSPASIVALAEEMTFCPSCDVAQLADAYVKPAPGIQESPFYDNDSRMKGANVDKGGRDPGNADVVHDSKDLPSGEGK